jgi:hypothetical protein
MDKSFVENGLPCLKVAKLTINEEEQNGTG